MVKGKKQIWVDLEKLDHVRNYYESQHPVFSGKFGDTMVVECALDHVCGKDIEIEVKKNKIRIK
jgi:hypothetical protein